jgi:glycerophosphoryl diester phosphodiesterase
MSDGGLETVASYAAGVGPAMAIITDDPSRAAAARRLGLEVHPYTVSAARLPRGVSDAAAYMLHLASLGATGVFTDNPDLFPR